MKTLIVMTAIILSVSAARADYLVTGEITGEECTSFLLFDKCETRKVDAVKGDDGKLYSVKRRYNSVSSYSNGRCWIRLKTKGGGLVSAAVNTFSGTPDFYEKQSDGSFVKVDLESITFRCEQR